MAAGLLCVAAGVPALGADSASYRWESVRIGGGGYVPEVAFSRAEHGLAYLRTDIGGIYRRDTRSPCWVPLQDAMEEGSYMGIEAIAPDPVDPEVVYAAAGMYYADPSAILRSGDRGRTWEIFPVSFRMGGNEDGRALGERLVVDPNARNVLYFGSRHDGLQRSLDGGRTWSKVAGFPSAGLGRAADGHAHGGVSFVQLDAASGKEGAPTPVIFAGLADPGEAHVFRSDDAGEHWRAVPGGPGARLLPLRAQADGAGRIWITLGNAIGPNGITEGAVYRLDPRTLAWTDVTPQDARAGAGGYFGLAVDRRHPGTVLVASIDRWGPGDLLWRTTDDGQQWESLREHSRMDVRAAPFLDWGDAAPGFGWWMTGLAIDPFDSDHVLRTTGAGVFETRSLARPGAIAPTTWNAAICGVEQAAVLRLASPPKGPHLVSGLSDLGGFVHEDLHAAPSHIFLEPRFESTWVLDFAAQEPGFLVRAGKVHAGDDGVAAWSADFGRHWEPLHLPTTSTDANALKCAPSAGKPRAWPELAVSADGRTVIAVQDAAALTHNRGRTWQRSDGLPAGFVPIADRVDSRRFYGFDAASGRLVRSTDGGAHFVPVAAEGFSAPVQVSANTRTPLVADAEHAQELWLLDSHGLYRSSDAGEHFSLVDGQADFIALSFGAPLAGGKSPTLYAIGAHAGLVAIWRSADQGAHWVRINDGATEFGRRFRAIAADPRVPGRVYVGTDGRGILMGEPAP